MALFTDGISSLQDLVNLDSSVLDTAQTENIDLNKKLAAAQQEIGVELTSLLQRSNAYDWQLWLRPTLQLNNVVVTSPLQLWHGYHTLAMLYQDAYGRQLNDRYAGKRAQYQALAKGAMKSLIETGVGIASDPVPQAALPQLSSIAGGQPATTYYVSVSWLNRGAEEGLPSSTISLDVAEGNILVVQQLNPPPNAAAWNVFVGSATETLVLQNDAPLDPAQIWIQSRPPATTGRVPGSGQAANYVRGLTRVIQRG